MSNYFRENAQQRAFFACVGCHVRGLIGVHVDNLKRPPPVARSIGDSCESNLRIRFEAIRNRNYDYGELELRNVVRRLMFLLGKKARPCSIRYPFGKSPSPRITDERLDELVGKLKAGDRSVIDEIVLGHLKLVVFIAGCYASLEPKKSKDLVQEAAFAVVQACHEIHKMNTDCFSQFVSYRIHEACGRFVHRDRLIPLSTHARYEAGQKDKKIMPNKEVAGKELSPLNKMILDETIHLAVKTEEERKIFDLKCAGYTFREIQELTGINYKTASLIFKVIEKRFLRGEQDEEAGVS